MRDYAVSVRRLVRDGLDLPLAGLLVAAAQPVPEDAEGVSRARSASEAFLYRRLETPEGTRSRFRLNATLAIPFDGQGRMEVDLLCEDSREWPSRSMAPGIWAMPTRTEEIGARTVLQENGYTVLRFLAEDLAKDLDSVLDAILRSLTDSYSATPLPSGCHDDHVASSPKGPAGGTRSDGSGSCGRRRVR
jgi:hypothetical protein